MGWLAELGRRHVLRVAAAYLALAWLLLQVTATVVPILDLPGWTQRLAFWLLAAGLAPALLLAWLFEWTPQGPVRDSRRRRHGHGNGGAKDADGARLQRLHKIDLAIIALLLVALGWSWIERAREPVAAPATTFTDATTNGSAATKATRAIAVLPFAAMSEVEADEFFADGLSEEILNRLVGTHGLSVVGRSSSFVYKDRPADLRGIARELGVDLLLEGSVRRAGDALRITAQLIDGRDGVQLWSRTYNQQLADIFAVQDAVAGDVARELSLSLAAARAGQAVATRNPHAMALYLQAKAAHEDGTHERFRLASAWLLEAITLDAEFAEAHALQAQIEIDQIFAGVIATDRAVPRARKAIDRALALAPDSPAVLAAAGRVLTWEADHGGGMALYDEAQRLVERALAQRPDDVGILLRQAWILTARGQFRAAHDVLHRVTRLEPIGELHRSGLAYSLWRVGDFEAARAQAARMPAGSRRGAELAARLAPADRPIEVRYQGFVDCIAQRVERCHIALGQLYLTLGDEVSALAAAAAVPEAQSADRELLRLWEMQRRGEWDAAREYILQRFPALLDAPNDWLIALGDQAVALGDWPEALRIWRRIEPDLFVDPPRTVLVDANPINAINVAYTLHQIEDTAGAQRIWRMLDAHFDAEPSFVSHPYRTLSAVIAAHALGHRDKARDRLKAAIAAGFRGERLFEYTIDKTPFPAGAAARNDPLLAPLLAELRERNRADLARLHAYLAEHGLPAVPAWQEPAAASKPFTAGPP